MFRFSIRDVLWLTVLVGLGVALCASWSLNIATSERHAQELAESHKLLVNAAQEWAKETGKPTYVNAGGHSIEAMPNGEVNLLSHVAPERTANE